MLRSGRAPSHRFAWVLAVAAGPALAGGQVPSVPAGYVPDAACRACHREVYDAYQHVGMAKSFSRPRTDRLIEDFSTGYYHKPSERHYRVEQRDDELYFIRFQLDPNGGEINRVELRIDWILGSGHTSRTYLYQTDSGELYQLPIAWYSQTSRWAMAPGFEAADHLGLTRRVRRECMFCHNAYPGPVDDADGAAAGGYWSGNRYPTNLPEGTGCQRCHGPGADHIRLGVAGVEAWEIRSAIVNPARLDPKLAADVCYSCHLQPSVALVGIRRFNRPVYSFRPGEPLHDYLVSVDVEERDRDKADRFEINHHPYRLGQSACFLRSEGRLGCTTCHDPHRKVAPAERIAHYRAACQSCHEPDACGLDHGAGGPEAAAAATSPDDCTACHMPRRRTQDVIEVVMTDHKIRRRPGGPELVAPIAKREPALVGVTLLHPKTAPSGARGEVYRAAATARVAPTRDAIEHLRRELPKAGIQSSIPHLDLAAALLKSQRWADVPDALAPVLSTEADHPLALEWLGTARVRTGAVEEGIQLLRRALAGNAERPETHFNLALFLLQQERTADAEAELERALELRPNLAAAWYYLGHIRHGRGELETAVDAFKQALAIDPSFGRAYTGIVRSLTAAGRSGEADRYLAHGRAVARSP